MNERTLKALEGSIWKWNLICMGVETDKTSYNCPLCVEFCTDGCDGCLVKLKTQISGCVGTPWERWDRVIDHPTYMNLSKRNIPWLVENTNPALVERLINLAWDELEFLITLLPEGHKWRKTL